MTEHDYWKEIQSYPYDMGSTLESLIHRMADEIDRLRVANEGKAITIHGLERVVRDQKEALQRYVDRIKELEEKVIRLQNEGAIIAYENADLKEKLRPKGYHGVEEFYKDEQLIEDLKTGENIDINELGLRMYKEGVHIVYSDIDRLIKDGEDWLILDECGNWAYVDPKRWKVIE